MKPTEEWLDFLLKESEQYQNLILDLHLNDAAGVGGMLGQLIRRGRGYRPDGILLTGPTGSGKHNVAWHILQALDEEDCAPVFLTGEALAEFRGDYPALAERLNALLERFYDNKQNLCLVLDEPELGGLGAQLYSFLGMTVRAYQSDSAGAPYLYLILIAEKQPPLGSLLRDMLLLCPCVLPDLEARTAFLTEHGKAIRNIVSLKQIAELTKGCSFADLRQIVDMVDFRSQITGAAPDEEALRYMIRQVSFEDSKPQEDPVAEALHRLEGVFTELKDALAKLDFSAIGESKSVKVEEVVVKPQINTEGVVPDQKSVEEMPVRRLSAELFGEDVVQALLAN